jgi:glycosyltransferase involved in cell wall biosynthesis
MLTSWEARCGIAAYSRGLVDALAPAVAVRVVPASFEPLPAAGYAELGRAMNGAQIAHAQHSYAFWGGMRPRRAGYHDFLRAVRVPLVVTVHELDDRATGTLGLPAPVERAYKRWFNRAAFVGRAVRAWVVHTEALKRSLCALGAPGARVHLLPMPVPAPAPAPAAAAARRRLGLEGRRVLTILGFLARRKGYEVALRALRELPADTLLLCAGGEHAADHSGTERWLRALAAELGVAERVRITGFVAEAELPAVLAASDLVLAPFTEMAGSASLHLALAYRKPVLASDLEPNRALGCVALSPTGDAPALAAAARRLLRDPGARAELGRAAAQYAADHSYAGLAERHLEIYRCVLPSTAGR